MPRRTLGLLLLAATACTSYRTTTDVPKPSAPLLITFATPRDVVVRVPQGESRILAGISQIRGLVLSASRDTLHVLLGTAVGMEGGAGGTLTGTVAVVPRDAGVVVAEPHTDGANTFAVVVLVVLLAAAVGLLLFIQGLKGAY